MEGKNKNSKKLERVNFKSHFNRSFVFRLTGCLHTAIFVGTIQAPYLRITPGHCTNIGEKDTLFKDREPPKAPPHSAARTYIAHIGNPPPPHPRAAAHSSKFRGGGFNPFRTRDTGAFTFTIRNLIDCS